MPAAPEICMILLKVADGVAGAMEECLAVYGGLVWSLARNMSPTHDDAEEAVQEIFLDVWRHAARFDPATASEATFVAMIARRRLTDRHRRRQSRLQPGPLPPALSAVPDGGPFRPEHCEDVELVTRLLDQLRPEERRVLELAVGHGQTQAEVAEQLGIPIGTVKSLARRGLLRLQTLVEAHTPPQRAANRTPVVEHRS
jgi:RNA polymerase sigma factor (sigma-70 family)